MALIFYLTQRNSKMLNRMSLSVRLRSKWNLFQAFKSMISYSDNALSPFSASTRGPYSKIWSLLCLTISLALGESEDVPCWMSWCTALTIYHPSKQCVVTATPHPSTLLDTNKWQHFHARLANSGQRGWRSCFPRPPTGNMKNLTGCSGWVVPIQETSRSPS